MMGIINIAFISGFGIKCPYGPRMSMLHELRNMINSILAPGNKRQRNTNSQMLLFSHTVETLGSVTAV